MDGRILTNKKIWKCPQGHGLGLIRNERSRNVSPLYSYRVTVVHLFRTAINLDATLPEWVDVAGKVRALGLRTMSDSVPAFLYDSEVILSHRSNLVRKLPTHYGPLWPEVSPDLPYKWVA